MQPHLQLSRGGVRARRHAQDELYACGIRQRKGAHQPQHSHLHRPGQGPGPAHQPGKLRLGARVQGSAQLHDAPGLPLAPLAHERFQQGHPHGEKGRHTTKFCGQELVQRLFGRPGKPKVGAHPVVVREGGGQDRGPHPEFIQVRRYNARWNGGKSSSQCGGQDRQIHEAARRSAGDAGNVQRLLSEGIRYTRERSAAVS